MEQTLTGLQGAAEDKSPVSQGRSANVKASWCPEPGSAEMIEPSVSCLGATGGQCDAEGSVVFLSPQLPVPRALGQHSRWSPVLGVILGSSKLS